MLFRDTFLFLLAALVLPAALCAMDYYVNDTQTLGDVYCTAIGSDVNNGTSPNTPKARVQAILDDYDLTGGDTIWIDTGFYTPTPSFEGHQVNIIEADGGTPGSYMTLQGSTNLLAGGTILDRDDTYYKTVNVYCSVWVRVRSVRMTGGGHGLSAHHTSNLWVEACDIYENPGGGIWLDSCPSANFRHTLSHDNGGHGLGFWDGSTSVYLDHCSIWNNHAGQSGGGAPGGLPEIYYGDGPNLLSMSNTIVQANGSGHRVMHFNWPSILPYNGNYNDLAAVNAADFISVGISAIWNLSEWQAATTQDTHSLSMDALLTADGHPKSKGGTWSNGTWVIYNTNSPCIDTGGTFSPYTNEPSPNGGRVNMGAFGNTAGASKSSDGDGDGLADNRELFEYGTNPESIDSDGDAYDDYSEIAAGTGATNSSSYLGIEATSQDWTGGTVHVSWTSVTGKHYTVLRSSDLGTGFTPLVSSMEATPPMNTITDTTATADGPYYYRIVLD